MKRALLPALVVLAGCGARLPAPKPAAPAAAHATCRRDHDEDELGRTIDKALRHRYALYGDAGVVGYVGRVGARVAGQTRQRSCSWTFRVLDLPAVNAFAFPGGYVYVTRGMLAALGSEAQLAAVLGHEIGHITAHHALDEHSWLEEQPYSPSRAELIHFYQRSRDNEREADQLAVGYVAAAGYDPQAVARMLSVLADVERGEGSAASASLWDDHPATEARVARAARVAAHLRPGRRVRARYLAAIDGLVYGDDPRHGYVRAGRFIRPDAGFALGLPHGWSSRVTDGMLLSRAPGGDDMLFLFRTRHATVSGVRAAFFDDGVRHDELVDEQVNGFPALVRKPIHGEKKHVALAIFEARGHAFLLFGGEQVVRGKVLAGLSPIADPELSDVRPHRLSVVRLREPTTLRALSGGDRELGQLVVLNHEGADARLGAGRFVKQISPGSARVSGRGSGTPRPHRDRLGGVGRHSGVEHHAHARKDGHRSAQQRAARREHP